MFRMTWSLKYLFFYIEETYSHSYFDIFLSNKKKEVGYYYKPKYNNAKKLFYDYSDLIHILVIKEI